MEHRSAQLASRGIASFALAYFGYDDLPKTLEEINISYFEEAVEFLLEHEKVTLKGFTYLRAVIPNLEFAGAKVIMEPLHHSTAGHRSLSNVLHQFLSCASSFQL